MAPALKQIKGELNQLTSTVCQRSVVGNEVDTVNNVVSPLTSTVNGAVQPVVGTVNSAVGTVDGAVGNALPGTTGGTYCFQSEKSQWLIWIIVLGAKRQVGQLTGVATSLVSQVKEGKLLPLFRLRKTVS